MKLEKDKFASDFEDLQKTLLSNQGTATQIDILREINIKHQEITALAEKFNALTSPHSLAVSAIFFLTMKCSEDEQTASLMGNTYGRTLEVFEMADRYIGDFIKNKDFMQWKRESMLDGLDKIKGSPAFDKLVGAISDRLDLEIEKRAENDKE